MTGFDWQRAQEALEHARQRLDGDEQLSGEAASELLAARARLLAQPLPEPVVMVDPLELLAFSRAGATYAVEAAFVVEFVPLAQPTPLPAVPPAIVGVFNHRGRVLAVVDVARLLPSPPAESGDAGFAVVVAAGASRFAITADAVSGQMQIEERAVRPATELGADRADTVVRGVTAAMVAILDVEALARDSRINVKDETE